MRFLNAKQIRCTGNVPGRNRPFTALLVLVFVAVTVAASGGGRDDLHDFLRLYPKFTAEEIQAVERGEAVARILDSPEKEEVFVFGAVKLRIPIRQFVDDIRNVESLEDGENYLVVKKFSNPPVLADVQRLTLEPEDLEDLKDCEPGDCDIQLPSVEIGQFAKQIDWKAPDVEKKVNQLAQQKALEVVNKYLKGGTKALSDYEDKSKPLNIAKTYDDLLHHTDALPVQIPEFYEYLLNYPASQLPGAEDFFYWEKVKFGLKPTIRGNHVIIYGGKDGGSDYVVAFKQLYATHYFLAALDLWFCLDDPGSDDFYLFTLKGSRQHGLTGFKGSILRKVVVGRTQDSVQQSLAYMKARFEKKP